MKSKSLYLFVLIVLFITIPAFSQKQLSKDEFIADIDSLYAAIYEIHPDMFAEYPQDNFEKDINNIKASLKDSLTVWDFYKKMTPLVVRLGDGHTRMSFPSQILETSNAPLFPFTVKIDKIDHSLKIDKDLSPGKTKILPGYKILSINGKKAEELINEFIEYESGEKMDFRLGGLEYYFAHYLYMKYGDAPLVIRYSDTNNASFTETIQPLPYSVRKKNMPQDNNQPGIYYTLSTDSINSTAIINFESFSDFSKFETFLDSAFTQIKKQKIKNLIIDIRNNGGGNSALGDELFQYISPVPFTQYGKVIVKYSNKLKSKMQNITEPNGLVTYENNDLIPLRDNTLRYNGNIYLLTSSHSFSSATDFAWAFQYFKMGTIIGEETGGLVVCFGDVLGQKLPNTELVFGVSWKKFYGYGATDAHTHGVIPEYQTPASEAMDFAIKSIKDKSYR